uniref:Uncharacterized protein n=1 Tax=Arundo donax TaxID=35708 RepID=A0A0A8YR97_ARUDO
MIRIALLLNSFILFSQASFLTFAFASLYIFLVCSCAAIQDIYNLDYHTNAAHGLGGLE